MDANEILAEELSKFIYNPIQRQKFEVLAARIAELERANKELGALAEYPIAGGEQ